VLIGQFDTPAGNDHENSPKQRIPAHHWKKKFSLSVDGNFEISRPLSGLFAHFQNKFADFTRSNHSL
jgi:hypothetical protein